MVSNSYVLRTAMCPRDLDTNPSPKCRLWGAPISTNETLTTASTHGSTPVVCYNVDNYGDMRVLEPIKAGEDARGTT